MAIDDQYGHPATQAAPQQMVPQQQWAPQQQQWGQQHGQPYPQGHQAMVPAPFGAPGPMGPIGKVRGTGMVILLMVVTLGIYSLVYYYSVHEELKRHSGQGLGGGIALLIAFLVGIASPFLLSSEVGNLYERRGQAKPVSGATGLWCFPGFVLVVGPIVWLVKTNGALNAYWRSLGAV